MKSLISNILLNYNKENITKKFSLKNKKYYKLLSSSPVLSILIALSFMIFTFQGLLQSSTPIPAGDSLLTSVITEKELYRISDFEIIETKEELQKIAQNQDLGFAFYRLKSGENLSSVSSKFNLSMSTVLSLNRFDDAHAVSVGQKVLLSTRSGIVFSLTNNESVSEIAERYGISSEQTLTVNDLSTQELKAGHTLFLPDANFSFKAMSEILGFNFINPIPGYRRLSSHFGWRRHPILGYRKLHTGTDFAARSGTSVRAVKEGRIIYAGWNGGHGKYIKIRHINGFTSSYSHLSRISVKNGEWVNAGERIGASGNTGLSTGPHLHFELHKYGQPVNAMRYGLQVR